MTISPFEFEKQAGEAGFTVKTITVYRLDGRPPQAIREAGGFLPNPTKPKLSMKDHVAPGCTGGSLFVSTSVVGGNDYNIRNTDFITAHQLRRPSEREVIAWMNEETASVKASLYRVFEYEMRGVMAAIVTQGGVEGEKEALISQARPNQISRVRPVFLRQRPTSVYSKDYDSWSRQFESISKGAVRLGSWRPFASTSF